MTRESTGPGGRGRDRDADRGVSTVVGYVLALAVTVALISGLITATGAVIEDRQATTARTGLEAAGERLAAKLMAADRLATTGADTVVVAVPLPDRVAGGSYTVTVNDSADAELVLASATTGAEVTVEVANRTDLAGATVPGGDLAVVLSGGELEVRRA